MAKQSVRFEYDLHEQVITPMQQILAEIKDIEILKKKLSNARLDMDSASNTLAKRKPHKMGVDDTQLLASAENASNQFHMAQDTYITALLSFSSKELDHIKPLQCLLTCQQRMYNDVSKILNTKLPGLQDNIEKTANTPAFGTDLDKHLENTGKPIASVLQRCCSSLLKSGLEQPGIFRLAGGLPQLRKLKAMFDSNRMEEEEWEEDVFTLAQAIKLYLRELPEPLLTFDLFEDWISCISNSKVSERLPRCIELVQKLPDSYKVNLHYLVWFLNQVAAREADNKMSPCNLGLVLGPNVLRTNNEDEGDSITALNASSGIVELMIKHYSTIFPEPLPADVTCSSLPRTAAIPTHRSSLRTHKKGKAPTPKKPNAAPAPPPRIDLDKSILNSPVSPGVGFPTTPGVIATFVSEQPPNPFDDSDEEEVLKTPDPPTRNTEGSCIIPQSDDCNPFNSPGSDNGLERLATTIKDEDIGDPGNPFGDTDSEGPTSPVPPLQTSPPPPSPRDSPVTIPESPCTTKRPPVLLSKQLSETKHKFEAEDVVNTDDTASPKFLRSNLSTPTHSRNASNSSAEGNGVKKHIRNQSDGKPAPPPRPSLEQ